MTRRYSRLLLTVFCALVTFGSVSAQISVRPLFSTDQDFVGNTLIYPDTQAAHITGVVVTLMPGDSTGWHRHAVPTFGYMLSGTLTVDYANGEQRIFVAGDGIIEAQFTPHIGHNYSTEPLSIAAFYAGADGVANTEPAEPSPPDDFVRLRSVIPDLHVELRYFSANNFTGRPVPGYEADVVYLTRPAAMALKEVQDELAKTGLGLKVFDAYRPQRAVNSFMVWAADPTDTLMKSAYYPKVAKQMLIPGGYIAERSGHSRGSTVDLTLIQLDSGEEVDMGASYDYFDPISWPSSEAVSVQQHNNRMKLREVMQRHGFSPLKEEWWHFTLNNEPHPDAYFDFLVQ